jgi:hypothetical protein
MKTEIPKEDGWYWMATPTRSTQQMTRVFTDGCGYRGVVVMNTKNPTGMEIHHDPYKNLEGTIFTKIEVPQ